jgi:hypothetical protein
MLCGCHLSISTHPKAPPNGKVVAYASPSNGGTTTGSGTYPGQTMVYLTATPTGGWTFSQWNDGVQTTTRYVTAKPNSTLTYIAYFVQNPPAPAAQFTVGWNATTGAASYQVYVGPSSGNYTNKYSASSTSLQLTVAHGSTSYVVCTAIGSTGLESTPSNEISYSAP